MKNKHEIDMTQGKISTCVIAFAIPLLLGSLFQQFYNMVDTWVVGNFVGNLAFSAVGSVGPVINMIIGLFTGFSTGASVIISQRYGASDYDGVSRAVHTSMIATLILSIIFTLFGVGLTPFFVSLMNTPSDVVPESISYLSIYFAGVSGLLFYNMGAAILRAVGDSQRPFYYLVVAAFLNVVLDLVFVLNFNMGVDGVAYSTIISQFISTALVIIELFKTDSVVKLRWNQFKLDKDLLKKIIRIGTPTGLQMAVTGFSNIFVQGYVNHFGADCMSGWTAYSKIDQLLWLPMQSVALSATTFVGQNLGNNDAKRASEGVKVSLYLSLAVTIFFAIPLVIYAPESVSFFNNKEEVVAFGTLFMRVMTPLCVVNVFTQVYAGALRGAGNAKAPTFIMIMSYVVFRQIYLFVCSKIWDSIIPISFAYPVGWVLCAIVMVYYYRKHSFKEFAK